MHFRTLQNTDVDRLFQFQLDNRLWFERFIAARDNDFYSKFNVEKHIADCLADYQSGIMYPALIEDDDKIVAIINLRNINAKTQSADIGYRVAQSETGKGIASFAIQEMLVIAKQNFSSYTLKSFVSVSNLASLRVLEKYNFKKMNLHEEFALVSNVKEDCFEYELKLA